MRALLFKQFGDAALDAGDYVPAGVNQATGGAAGAAVEVHGQEIGLVGLGGHSRIISQIGGKWMAPGQGRLWGCGQAPGAVAAQGVELGEERLAGQG